MSEREELHYIDEPLRAMAVRIDSLLPDPGNENTHDARSIQGIMASLSKFGQAKPIVVRASDMIVAAGNGTLEAAKQLGWEYIAANIKEMTATEFAAFKVIDNRSAQLASWDTRILEASLEALSKEADLGIDMNTFFNQAEMDTMFGPATWSVPEGEAGGGGTKSKDSEDSTEGYEEKITIRVKEMTVRVPLIAEIRAIISSKGWSDRAEVAG